MTKTRKLAMMFVIASFLLSGCSPFTSSQPGISGEECLANDDNALPPVTGVFIEPDDGYEPVVEEIEAARCTLDLTMYMLTDDVLFQALIAARDRGVEVRVILEQHPFGMFGDQQEAFERLEDAGIAVQWGRAEFQFTHAKYMVVDRQTAVIVNLNFTGAAFNSNREMGVITTESEEVRQAQEVFDADWSGENSGSIDGPLLVSPDNSRARLLQLINEAAVSIDFYAELIRDEEVMASLERAVSRGVRVRLIMNASLDPEDEAAVAELAASGVEVRLMDVLYVHTKTMVIDGERALIGSINYSMTSLDRNREVAMVVDNPALVARAAAVYERDWMRSSPATASPAAVVHGQWVIRLPVSTVTARVY